VKPLNPLFKVFGSKWSAIKRGNYPAPIEDSTIYEPFAGGAGYSLNYHWHKVVIYDTNPHIACLWRWLILSATSDDIMGIPLNLPVGSNIRDCPDLSYGQQLLLKSWQRTNNHGNCFTISKWGNLPGQFTANTRARLAEEIHAIKHWEFREVTWDQPGTYFCDSPYIYNYRYGVKDFDFAQYAANVNALPQGSLAICCEAVCPKTQAVPDYLPFEYSPSQVTSRRKTTENHHSKELVYIKYT
jgi:hypothetical protein